MIVEIVVEHSRDSLHARLWRQTHTMRKGQCSMHGCTGLLAVETQHTCYALHTPHCKGLPLGGIRCRTSPRTRVTPSVAVRYNSTTPSEGLPDWLALSLVNCLVAMERLGNSLCAASLIRRLSILPLGAGPV